jgi:aryl-alcohol dehydrogenase-like predicted oxidoreductase
MGDLRQVGSSGLRVSTMGLGCNNFGMRIDQEMATAVVHAALDVGTTLFDTADSYSNGVSEEFLGKALAGHRDDVVIATKAGGPLNAPADRRGASRRHLVRACEDSLRRLGTDHIDLYYQHYPDPGTPIEESLGALDQLIAQGKIRYAACSNFAGWQVIDAHHVARTRALQSSFVASQVEWSLLERRVEVEHVPACAAAGMGVIPYFPLASGVLSGKYRKDQPLPSGTRIELGNYFASFASPERLEVVERLIEFAEARGHTVLDLALSWISSRSQVASVLVGATSPEQVKANADAFSWELSADDEQAIEALLS